MTVNKQAIKYQLIIIIVGLILFLPGLGNVHLFDWDEINFAESAREMLLTGDYLNVQINFEKFWEKPPLFIWMQVASMKVFGVNEFAARLPNVICGITTLLLLFNIGKKLKNVRFGITWTLLYVSSILPFFYFKSGIIDPWFNLFIFLGIVYAYKITITVNEKPAIIHALLAGFYIGLAILTKGPVGLLIFMISLSVYVIIKKFKVRVELSQIIVFIVSISIVGGLWFILQLISGNYTILKDFIEYQIRLFRTEDAGHGGFLFYHFVILLMGVFPASILALPVFKKSIFKSENDIKVKEFMRWMMIVLWVVLILFTIVRTKIVHYSSMGYLPLTFLATWYIDKVIDNHFAINKWIKVVLLIIAIIFGVVLTLITFFDKIKPLLIPYTDEFTRGNLQATADWKGFEWIFGIILIIGTILFIRQYKNNKIIKSFITLTASSLVFVFGAMYFVTPQVEKYSQLAAIEFYQSKTDENCYIYPINKSYAHYFYSQRKPENNNANKDFLQRGNIDKPCYFIVRNTKYDTDIFHVETPQAVRLYDKNGFVFYIRKP